MNKSNSMYHPVGTEFKMGSQHFQVSGVDHKSQTYTLQQKGSDKKTFHAFSQVHNKFKPQAMAMPHVQKSEELLDKIELIEECISTIKRSKLPKE